jgi:hypothetical protein
MSATAKSMSPPLARLPKSGSELTATAMPAPFQYHRHVPPSVVTSAGLNPGLTESSQCWTAPDAAVAFIDGEWAPSVNMRTLRMHNETKTDLFISPPFYRSKEKTPFLPRRYWIGHQRSQRIEVSWNLHWKHLVSATRRLTTLMNSIHGTATVGWGIAQQSRLTALLNSSGEFGLEWELEQDAPLRFRWSLSASYAGIVSPFRGEGQEESEIAAESGLRAKRLSKSRGTHA